MAHRQVLIVDDEPLVRTLMHDALAAVGYQVIEAGDGVEALQLIAQHDPSVVLLDMGMPVMDGARFAEAVHRLGLTPKICVVTGQGTERAAASQIGADACLAKPFTIAELHTVVESLEGENQPSRQTPKQELIELVPTLTDQLAANVLGYAQWLLNAQEPKPLSVQEWLRDMLKG